MARGDPSTMDAGEVLRGVAEALRRATLAGTCVEQEAINGFPPIVVKNTFLEVQDPEESTERKSQSCPIAAFGSEARPAGEGNPDIRSSVMDSTDLNLCDLTSAARIFSAGEIPREVMEASGHLVSRVNAAPEEEPSAVGSRPLPPRPLPPPPLLEPDLQESVVPAVPPAWSPKVASGTPLHAYQRPVPPALQTPHGHMMQSPQCNPGFVPSAASPSTQQFDSWFRVAYLGGISLRAGPYFDGMHTGATLVHNEIFSVCEEIPGPDGRIYLRLSDGRGWAFDDSALMPHDPSVVRGRWAPMSASSTAPPPSTAWEAMETPSTVWEPMEEPMTPFDMALVGDVEVAKKKRRRRKRGGVKRRPKAKAVALEDAMSEAEAPTDAPPSEATPSDVDATSFSEEAEVQTEVVVV